jgi:hypothetical protein
MKNIRFFLFLIVLFFALLITNFSFATSRGIQIVSKQGEDIYLYKDYHAIVIGISDYEKWPKLPNAVNDAKEVAIKLKQIGFNVQLVVNPTSDELKFTFNDIARRLGTEKNRALLVYFAGHGETTMLADGSQLGFIVPKDCPLQNLDPLDFDRKAVSMKEIEMLALRVKSIHMLMLFDSCFSGSLFSMKRAAPRDVSEKSANPVRQFITAGAADEPVPDKSVFKICFLQGLAGYADYNKDKYITGSELGMYLQTKVINYSKGAQHPQYGKINNPLLDKGDFIFAVNADRNDVNNELDKPLNDEELASAGVESKEPLIEKKAVASIPKISSDNLKAKPSRESPYKIAILPCILKNRAETFLHIIMSEINRTIEKSTYFTLSRSYYQFGEVYQINKNEIMLDDVWQPRGKSQKIPNAEIISSFGRKLKVDTILVFSGDIYNKRDNSGGTGNLNYKKFNLYLIDVRTVKVVSEIDRYGEIYEISSLAKKLIDEYKKQLNVP